MGECPADDVMSVPCNFGGKAQFILRPQNTDDFIFFASQTSNTGAFIDVYG